MKKHIALAAAVMIMSTAFTACGRVDTSDPKKDSKKAAAEITPDGDNESIEPSDKYTGAVTVNAVAENLFGGSLSSKVTDAGDFFGFAESVYASSDKTGEGDKAIIEAFFSVENEEYYYSYCGRDNVFVRVKIDGSGPNETTFFTPDEASAVQLRDMMAAYSVLGLVLDDTSYTVLPEHTNTNYIADIAGSLPSLYDETRYCYINERDTRIFNLETEGDAYFYLQETSSKTDAVVEDTPYYETSDYYEYFTDGNGKAFYRPDQSDVFYPAEEFKGDIAPVPLAKGIAESETYLYSFEVKTTDSDMTVEVWQGDGSVDYILIENGSVRAMWDLLSPVNDPQKNDGLTLMHSFRTDEAESGNIDEIIAHAEQHLGTEAASEKTDTHTEEPGMFDLSSIQIGQEVEPTGVVEEWRDYISSGDKPFTLREFRWAGAGRNEYRLTTFDGGNYYINHEMDIHGDPDSTGSEEWYVDGRFFQSVYYMREKNSREVTEWEPSGYGSPSTDLLFENEKYNEDYAGSCIRAYEVMIGNERYICEEWSLYLDRLWKVYIKDGNIVAWEGDFYSEPTVNTVIRLEKTADSELLKIPANAKKHIPDD